jgi:hypothetical protein
METSDAASINFHYGELQIMMRQRAEQAVRTPESIRVQAILESLDGFEFSTTTSGAAATKWLLLEEFEKIISRDVR